MIIRSTSKLLFKRLGGWVTVGLYVWTHRKEIKETYVKIKSKVQERVQAGGSYKDSKNSAGPSAFSGEDDVIEVKGNHLG